MPDGQTYQSAFTSGEWSSRLVGRSDLNKYRNAAILLQNFIVQKHGGATRRPGTAFVAGTKDSDAGTDRVARLVEFEFSVTQTYMLEFGHQYIRFYRDGAQMIQSASDPSPDTITELSAPWGATELAEIKYTQSADVLYLCHPDYETRTLSRGAGSDTDPATWTLATLDPQDGPYLDLNAEATTLTPAAVTGSGITVTASATTGINGGDGFKSTDVGRSIRIGNGTLAGWALIVTFTDTTNVDVDIQADFPSTAATTEWQLGAWSDTTGWPWTPAFHQQRLWIAGTDTQPQTMWASESGNFDAFQPAPLGAMLSPTDTDGVSFTIDDDRVNAMRWLRSDARGLLAMTDGGVFVNSAQDPFAPITPATPFAAALQIKDGAHATVRPHSVAGVVLMPKIQGTRILEIVYRFEDDKFVAPDMTLLAEHITEGGLTSSAYQDEPDSVLWCARADGLLLGMTYERAEEVVGWHRHIIGGSLDGESSPIVESVASIREGGDDQVWMIVKRTIDGQTKRYVELMQPQFGNETEGEDAWFVDSGLALDSGQTVTAATQTNPVQVTAAAHGFSDGDKVRIRDVKGMTEINGRTFTIGGVTTNTFNLTGEDGSAHTAYVSGGEAHKETLTVSGLGHLEGQTVQVFADGAHRADATVSSGAITLGSGASRVQIGLGYTSKLTTMPLVPASQLDSRGRLKRAARITVWFERSLGGRFGVDGAQLDTIEYRDASAPMDSPPALFSGSRTFPFPSSSDLESRITVETSVPQPMTVLSIAAEVQVGDT